MYIVDFSHKEVKYISFKKTLLGKYEIKECGIVDTQEEDWRQQLRDIIKSQKIALVIPEDISKIIRFSEPHDTGEKELKEEVEKKISEGENIEDFAFDCGIKKHSDGPSDVLCLAAPYKELAPIFSLAQECDAKPTYAVPESLSIFRILKDGIIEGEIVLLLDIEEDNTHFIFYDSTGPIEKKTVPTDLKLLDKTTLKAIESFKEKKEVQINRVVLNGNLSSHIEPFEFRKSVGILTIKAEDVLKDRLSKLQLSFECGGENVGRYINAIATGLITQDASGLNLVKNDVLMNVEKYTMEKKDELDNTTDDSDLKKDDKDTQDDTKSEKKSRPRLTTEPIEEDKKEPESRPVEENKKEDTKEEEKSEKNTTMSHTIGSPDSQFRSSFRAEESSGNGGGKKKIFLFVVVALLVALIAGIALFLLGEDSTTNQQEPTTTQEPSPTPSPTPEPDRGDISIQILNGSGEAGLAGDVAASLEDLGYEDGIDTGNADSYDYEETVIQLKEEFENYFDLLRDDLVGEGFVVDRDFEELDEDAEYDGVIIVGSLNEDQAEEETEDEVTPTPEEETEEEEEEPTPTPEEE